MYNFSVGQTVESFKNHPEVPVFDVADGRAVLVAFFRYPSANEVEQFQNGKNFEIRFTELGGIIMVSVKVGTLKWMDMPYTPHLSENLTNFQVPSYGGLALTLVLVDAITGEIKSIRLLGLSKNFTQRLLDTAKAKKQEMFDIGKYKEAVSMINSRYTTKEIVNLSRDYCKISE